MTSATCALATSAVSRSVEPVGQHFLAHARRKRHSRTFSEDERLEAEKNVKNVEEVEEEEAEEPESAELLKSDPKDWKKQDHYAVLGLSKYRYRANDAQIKKAHRKKVLKHHPDKKAALSGNVNDDAFFKCIAKAFEILSDPVKRRQYDSVDEGADVPEPSKKSKDFYKAWGRFFEAEGRFSNRQPVPKLGGDDAPKNEVDQFYDFFYNFDSWRTFEYLDKDLPDDTDSRDQRRYQEKKNKAERAQRKKEDNARLRAKTDEALSLDPRYKRFKEEEKAAKAKAKWDREAGAREAAEKARLEKEAADKKAADEAAASAANKAESKAAKEAAKKNARKDKKTIKAALKDCNYFFAGANDAPIDVVDKTLSEIESLMEQLEGTKLSEFAKELTAAGGDKNKLQSAFASKGVPSAA
ncbi:Zuotin [Savitreella phatthalungensis]